jgi:preprotein translocase subunit YajC
MQPTPNPLYNFIPLGIMLAIMYVLIIRPQQKERREHDDMLGSLKKGDRILTTGGLYGTIVGTKGDDLEVRFAENVKLTVARSAVAKRTGATAPETAAANGGQA